MGKPEGKRLLGRFGQIWDDNNIDPEETGRNRMEWDGVEWIGLRTGVNHYL
jgi:hypothetical protein